MSYALRGCPLGLWGAEAGASHHRALGVRLWSPLLGFWVAPGTRNAMEPLSQRTLYPAMCGTFSILVRKRSPK